MAKLVDKHRTKAIIASILSRVVEGLAQRNHSNRSNLPEAGWMLVLTPTRSRKEPWEIR